MRSQNGWTVYDSPPDATIPFITGRVRPGDVDIIFTYLGQRFNDEVEHIRKDWSWGWAKRNVRGTSAVVSNHSSATAVDFNAPAHPLGKRGTFNSKQVKRIHAILDYLEGVVRWGGDYQRRADEMHFEIVGNAAAVKRVARKILDARRPAPWKWNPEVVSNLALVQKQFQIAAGHREGKIQRYHGVAAIQNALNVKANARLKVDGYVGPDTVQAFKAYEREHGGTGYATTPDPVSLGPTGLQIMYRFTGPEVS